MDEQLMELIRQARADGESEDYINTLVDVYNENSGTDYDVPEIEDTTEDYTAYDTDNLIFDIDDVQIPEVENEYAGVTPGTYIENPTTIDEILYNAKASGESPEYLEELVTQYYNANPDLDKPYIGDRAVFDNTGEMSVVGGSLGKWLTGDGDGFLAQTWDFVEDNTVRAVFQGLEQIDLANTVGDITIAGDDSPEAIERLLEKVNNSNVNLLTTTEAINFQKQIEEGGDTWGNSISAFLNNPTAGVSAIISSYVGMFNKYAVPAAAAAGGGAWVAGQPLVGASVFGAPITEAGVTANAIRVALSTAGSVTDGLSSMVPYMKDELEKKGLKMNPEGLNELLKDKEAMARIKSRAARRGGAVFGVNMLTFGAGSRLRKLKALDNIKMPALRKAVNIAIETGVQLPGEGVGELAAQIAAEEEISPSEVVLEAVGGLGDVAGAFLAEAPKYRVGNNKTMSKNEVRDYVKTASSEEISDAVKNDDIEITGDNEFSNEIAGMKYVKVLDNGLNISKGNFSPDDRKRVLGLGLERDSLSQKDDEASKSKASLIKKEMDALFSKSRGEEFKPVENPVKLEDKTIKLVDDVLASTYPDGLPSYDSKKQGNEIKPEANAVQQVQGETKEGVLRDERVEQTSPQEEKVEQPKVETPKEKKVKKEVKQEAPKPKPEVIKPEVDQATGEVKAQDIRDILKDAAKKDNVYVDLTQVGKVKGNQGVSLKKDNKLNYTKEEVASSFINMIGNAAKTYAPFSPEAKGSVGKAYDSIIDLVENEFNIPNKAAKNFIVKDLQQAKKDGIGLPEFMERFEKKHKVSFDPYEGAKVKLSDEKGKAVSVLLKDYSDRLEKYIKSKEGARFGKSLSAGIPLDQESFDAMSREFAKAIKTLVDAGVEISKAIEQAASQIYDAWKSRIDEASIRDKVAKGKKAEADRPHRVKSALERVGKSKEFFEAMDGVGLEGLPDGVRSLKDLTKQEVNYLNTTRNRVQEQINSRFEKVKNSQIKKIEKAVKLLRSKIGGDKPLSKTDLKGRTEAEAKVALNKTLEAQLKVLEQKKNMTFEPVDLSKASSEFLAKIKFVMHHNQNIYPSQILKIASLDKTSDKEKQELYKGYIEKLEDKISTYKKNSKVDSALMEAYSEYTTEDIAQAQMIAIASNRDNNKLVNVISAMGRVILHPKEKEESWIPGVSELTNEEFGFKQKFLAQTLAPLRNDKIILTDGSGDNVIIRINPDGFSTIQDLISVSGQDLNKFNHRTRVKSEKVGPGTKFKNKNGTPFFTNVRAEAQKRVNRKDFSLAYEIRDYISAISFLSSYQLEDGHEGMVEFWEKVSESDFMTFKDEVSDAETIRAKINLHKFALAEAKNAKALGTLYLDYAQGTRTRYYTITNPLTHQGDKVISTLIPFSKGVPLGRFGLPNLLIAAAKLYGFKYVNEGDFLAEAIENIGTWIEWVENPGQKKGDKNYGWQEADEVAHFVETVKEIKAALESGDVEGFESHSPIEFDQSNSGLSIMSTVTRDPKGMLVTNTLQSDAKRDGYIGVAETAYSYFPTIKESSQMFGKEDMTLDDILLERNKLISKIEEFNRNIEFDKTQKYLSKEDYQTLKDLKLKKKIINKAKKLESDGIELTDDSKKKVKKILKEFGTDDYNEIIKEITFRLTNQEEGKGPIGLDVINRPSFYKKSNFMKERTGVNLSDTQEGSEALSKLDAEIERQKSEDNIKNVLGDNFEDYEAFLEEKKQLEKIQRASKKEENPGPPLTELEAKELANARAKVKYYEKLFMPAKFEKDKLKKKMIITNQRLLSPASAAVFKFRPKAEAQKRASAKPGIMIKGYSAGKDSIARDAREAVSKKDVFTGKIDTLSKALSFGDLEFETEKEKFDFIQENLGKFQEAVDAGSPNNLGLSHYGHRDTDRVLRMFELALTNDNGLGDYGVSLEEAKVLASFIEEAVAIEYPGATAFMEMFKAIQKDLNETYIESGFEGEFNPFTYSTIITNLPVVELKNKTKKRVIEVRIGDKKHKITFGGNGVGRLNFDKMLTGIAPDITHSLDAQIAAYIIWKLNKEGIEVIPNHDGFSVHPSNVDRLRDVFQEAIYNVSRNQPVEYKNGKPYIVRDKDGLPDWNGNHTKIGPVQYIVENALGQEKAKRYLSAFFGENYEETLSDESTLEALSKKQAIHAVQGAGGVSTSEIAEKGKSKRLKLLEKQEDAVIKVNDKSIKIAYETLSKICK